MQKLKFGTKNLPDAIDWHSAFCWGHSLNKKQIRNSYNSHKLLKSAIAIPIFLKKSLNDYKNLASEIKKVVI